MGVWNQYFGNFLFCLQKGLFSREQSNPFVVVFSFCFSFPRGLQAGEMRIIYPSELLQVFISAGFLLLSSRFFLFSLFLSFLFSFIFLSGNLKDEREGEGREGVEA